MDTIDELVRTVCDSLQQTLRSPLSGPGGKPLELSIRADRIRSAGVIHAEIWESLADADVVVADISGLNANVLFELGAAAVRLPKERVVLIREESGEEERAFDLSPIRHFRYSRSLEGIRKLTEYLSDTLQYAVTHAIFGLDRSPEEPPISLDLKGADSPLLFTPPECHRRISAEGLEFGSFDYTQSFLCAGSVRMRNVRAEATVRFARTFHPSHQDEAFFGISVRAEHPYANFSNMLLVTYGGRIKRTVPDFTPPYLYHDDPIGEMPPDSSKDEIRVVHEIRDDHQHVVVNQFRADYSLSEDRIRHSGLVLLQASNCIIAVKHISVVPI